MTILQKWWVRILASLVFGSLIVEIIRMRTSLIDASTSVMLCLAFALIIYFCLTFMFAIYNRQNPRKLDLRKGSKDEESQAR